MTGIGILAEDESDCDALTVLVRRIRVPTPGKQYKVKTRPSEGCSKLRRKGTARLRELAATGCDVLIVVHDLDRNNEQELRAKLENEVLNPTGTTRLICIPCEELEAWFWSDQKTLDHVTRGTRIAKESNNPHTITSPKEKLIAASCGSNRKPIYTTNMNKKLAEILDLDKCAERCPGFRSLRNFLLDA